LKYLSIILPVYNNSNVLKSNLPYLADYLAKKEYEYEIIIVDDGSRNEEEVKNISNQFNCRYVRNNNNSGKGSAVRTGMVNSEGIYRIFTDADIPYEGEDLDKIIQNLETGKYDLAIGDRSILKSFSPGDVTFLRSFGSKFFSFVVGGLMSGKFGDTQCGLKGFTAKAASELFRMTRINGFAIDVELLFLALKKNYKICKVPVKLRKQGVSTVKVFKHGFLMLVDLVKIKINRFRRKYD
jgi:dolichyl-phosphate beta-glucosyltransferase